MKTLITATEALDPALGGAEISMAELLRGVCASGPIIENAPSYEPLEDAIETELVDPWEVISFFTSFHGETTDLTKIDGLKKVTKNLPVKGPLSFLGWRFRNSRTGSPNKIFFGADLRLRNKRFEGWLNKEIRSAQKINNSKKVGLTQLKWSAGASKAFLNSEIPYILFIRDQTHFEFPEIYRDSIENAEVVCGAGEGLLEDIQERFEVKRLENIPLPVNFSSRFGSKEEIERKIARKFEFEENNKGHGPRIAIVGITPEKGLETYEKLLPRMAINWPEATFDVYGWNQKFLKNIISMPNVNFHGRKDVEEIFLSCDIQVILAETTGSWGRVISEGGLFNIPTVTNSVGSQPEAVGRGGVVVKNHKDMIEFESAIKLCYSEREKLGMLAREHCKTVDHRRTVAKFRSVLESI